MTPDDPPPPTVADPDVDRARLLRTTLCAATLAMVALSWPLWIDLADFPAVPFVRWFPDYPRPWSWLGLAGIAAGLGLGMTRRLGRVGVGLAVAVLAWLILGDQLRFQPWIYQFLVTGSLLVALPPRSALAFSRVWMASVYFHSGLSKIDASFARGMGPLFVRTLARVLGLDAHPGLVSLARLEATALVLPAAEIAVAILLLVPRTRRLGYVGAVLMHAALLLILGPWGLGHSAIVLVWNGALAVEEYLLFWPATDPEAAPSRWTWRERLVGVPFASLLVLPLGERAGLFDSWPSHALYADHCEGATIAVRGELPGDWPRDARIAARPASPGWWTLNPTDWTRRVRGVPAYPQGRYANGLAEWLAGRTLATPRGELLIEHRLRADPRAGIAGTRTARDLKEVRDLGNRFWFNAHPRDRSRR